MGELANPALKTVLAPKVIPALAVAAIAVGETPALVPVIKPALILFLTTLAAATTPPVKAGVIDARVALAWL